MELTTRNVAFIATFQLSLLAFVPVMMLGKGYPFLIILPIAGMLIGPVITTALWIRNVRRRRKDELQLSTEVEKFLAESTV